MRSVVTGANRGIGLELVRQLLERGDEVHAGVRDPDRADELRAMARPSLRIHRLDVTSDASVAALASALADQPVDVVLNVAGTYGGPHQGVDRFDAEDALRTFDTNALGALRVSLALLPRPRRGATRKLVHVTSGMGSIADNTSGGSYAYRMSKAALNMMARGLAIDLRRDNITSFVINPGWVQTDMGGPSAPTPVEDSVRGLLRCIDAATLDVSGEFLDWKGGRYPW